MSLAQGTKLGSFEIVAPIGAGGMGEVYRATDSHLKRSVAIKVLPASMAADADRLARFQREAEVLAALNHPNIAQIYGLEKTADLTALVMELVEGEDLSAHIARGPIALPEALAIAKQVADALEAAHELGIVHRDLKPQNIKVRADGTVKVLDFGLAKARDPAGASSADAMHSPTLTARATQMGMILGTAAYMAPEQARGKVVDRRADIWAFGVVLYEMLAGRRAFEGEDISITLANVMKDDVAWDALPKDLPAALTRLLRRCLEKEPKKRLRDIGEARLVLDDPTAAQASTPSSVGAAPVRAASRAWPLATALLAVVVIVGAVPWWRAPGAAPASAEFTIPAPDNMTFMSGANRLGTVPVISPDGRLVAFTAADESGTRMVWVRPVDSLIAAPLAGTENGGWPFWSPDSRTIAYSAKSKLMKIAVSGGPAVTICDLNPNISARGGTWNRDNVIVFNNGPAPLYRVSSAGGVAIPMGTLTVSQGGRQFPAFLPDQRHFLYNVAGSSNSTVWVGSLDSAETKSILQADTGAVYDARSGRLLFGRQGLLLAQAFDPETFALSGDAFPIADRLESAVVPGVVAFSLSETGVLVYGVGAAAGAGLELAWVDRHGQKIGTVGPVANYRGIDLSPDGTRVAAHRHDGEGGDIWITNVETNATSRLTFNAAEHNASPAWSRDGKRIAFSSRRSGKSSVEIKSADSTGDDLRVFENEMIAGAMGPQPHGWAADGRSVLFGMLKGPETAADLWLVPATGDGKAAPLLNERFYERFGQFSPDGRWIAYQSTETGAAEIYLRPASATGGKWAASTSGGAMPRWRDDGRELFYVTNAMFTAVDVVSDGTALRVGTPKPLFRVSLGNQNHDDAFPYAVRKDGQAFLIQQPVPTAASAATQSPIVVVLNWNARIKK